MNKSLKIAFDINEIYSSMQKSKRLANRYGSLRCMILLMKRLYKAGHTIIVWSNNDCETVRNMLRKLDLGEHTHLIENRKSPNIVPDIAFDNNGGKSKLATIRF